MEMQCSGRVILETTTSKGLLDQTTKRLKADGARRLAAFWAVARSNSKAIRNHFRRFAVGEKFTAGTGVNPRNPVPAVVQIGSLQAEGETQETSCSPQTYVGLFKAAGVPTRGRSFGSPV